ncbi:MAG: methyltransferase domain-containing protein [archaeon]
MDKDYYSEISSGYNELYGEEQKAKFELIKKHIKFKPLVLDIGCGTGIVGVKAVGIDPSLGLLKEHPGLRVCAMAEELPFKDSTFSTIISLTALHHTDINKAIKEIERVAKPGATFVFTILKKAKNFQEIAERLKSKFDLKEIDQEKDLILVKH